LRSKGRRDAALETLLELGAVAVDGDQVRALMPYHLLTPANVANPAKTRATTGETTIANGCDFCESDGDDSENRNIRNRSQIADSQALQAKSQESQGVASQLSDDEEVRL